MVVLASFSLMTACGKKEKPPNREKTVVQFLGHINEAWNKSHKSIIAKFNASQNEIEIVRILHGSMDLKNRIHE